MKSHKKDLKAVFVGQGQLFEWVSNRIRTLGLEEIIHLAGYQNDPSRWLIKSKISALCSDSEGLSLALMESCYVGLPAVISNVGDLPDLVEDGVNGFLISDRTPEAFSDAMLKLLNCDKEYRNYSVNTKQRAQEYSLERTREKWEQVLSI
jgi:glycosyltransferase involved in cell wall biosynthesis